MAKSFAKDLAICIPFIEQALEPIIEIAFVFNKFKLPSAYIFFGGFLIFFKFLGNKLESKLIIFIYITLP